MMTKGAMAKDTPGGMAEIGAREAEVRDARAVADAKAQQADAANMDPETSPAAAGGSGGVNP
jgi:hypothetical protein